MTATSGSAVVLGLTEPAARDQALTGAKAATLATLIQAGFAVPDGSVITPAAFAGQDAITDGDVGKDRFAPLEAAVRDIASRHDGVRLAVRSSGVAEDLPDASFAGLYETVLDVCGLDDIRAAVHRCRASADLAEARDYRMGAGMSRDMAVLVQRLVSPSAAGIAFGADPITGDRATVLVSAVQGSGAPLAAGQASGEDWQVTGQTATCRHGSGEVLRASEALSVASLLRQVEQLLGGPLDMEWATADGTIWVLQARPMTVVQPEVSWTAPLPGGWFRGIRLGEWLPEPVTPLCDDWLLARVENRLRYHQAVQGGVRAPAPLHVLVEGWYYHSPIGTGRSGLLLAGLARRPRQAVATVVGSRRPVLADKLYFGGQVREWQEQVLHPYQRLIADAWRQVDQANPAELVRMVNQVAEAAGDFLWSLVTLGGAAWRSEVALARFHYRHLRPTGVAYQELLSGLTPPPMLSHAVQSLDWIRPTLAELAGQDVPTQATGRSQQIVAARVAAEQACRTALATAPPRYLARFESLLGVARRYALVRWELTQWFPLGWPLLRTCVRRLGAHLHASGQIDDLDDLFFLTLGELQACLAAAPPAGIADLALPRRAEWERQRRLNAPLALGKPPFLLAKFLLSTPRFLRAMPHADDGDLSGIPASPGIATGPVRIVLDGAAADAVQPGDVLVVPAVVPAMTPLFGRIAAVCADNGSVAAHTSIVAREYGIPSVTGLGNATRQLADGTLVTVDGSTGRVMIR